MYVDKKTLIGNLQALKVYKKKEEEIPVDVYFTGGYDTTIKTTDPSKNPWAVDEYVEEDLDTSEYDKQIEKIMSRSTIGQQRIPRPRKET